jgi:hypothetical protein
MDVDNGEKAPVGEDQRYSTKELERKQGNSETQFKAPSTTAFFTADPFTPGTPSHGIQQIPESELLGQRSRSSTNSISIRDLPLSNSPESTRFLQKPMDLTRDEGLLFHHFTVHLGNWLDCTSASRKLTLKVPEMARQSPSLFYAVLCFAARHRGEEKTAEAAYQRCITLLIEHLDEKSAIHDEMLLTAVIILHFADQLNGVLPP